MAAHSSPNLSIVEAVETLSSIADLEFDREIGIAQKHDFVLGHEKIAYKTVHWLHQDDAPATVNLVRETFRVILNFLKQFYKKEYSQVTDQKTLEGIKTIMVLVGEAAKKLDKYSEIFHQTQRVTDFKEYKQLQDFYRSKIARKIDDKALSKWVLGLTSRKVKAKDFKAAPKKSDQLTNTAHVFVDLETVKKDTEYELFFIRKEDGSRFFSPRLLRNMKLVCDFGKYFGERKELDPLEHIKHWYDRSLQLAAKEIIKTLGSKIDVFFHETQKDHEVFEILNKALLALMLSAHSQNLLRHHPIKSCSEYFEDFQGFLRESMQTSFYQNWMSHSPKENNQLALNLIDFIHSICQALYVNLRISEETKTIFSDLIHQATLQFSRDHEEGSQLSKKIWEHLANDYLAMSKLLKHHPNGPLIKVLDILEENSFHVFDPISHGNLPNQLFNFYTEDKHYSLLRIPSPIYQEFINKAIVNDEFKGFLNQNSKGAVLHKHLLINFQDRTSWREYARCLALEDLNKVSEDGKAICTVVTLAVDTDFYHQLSPYHQVNHAHLFKEQFKDLLLDKNGGYFFPDIIDRKELSEFITQTLDAIHRVFFSSKNVILRESRLDFIEIFHFFLQLKLIEWTQPDTVSLTSKDSIDTGETHSIEMFAFLKLMNHQSWSEVDWEHVNSMIYAPAIFIRERLMLPERFNRMLGALKTVENVCDEMGTENFAKKIRNECLKLFKTPIIHSQLVLPH